MTVIELIERLRELPPDADVWMWDRRTEQAEEYDGSLRVPMHLDGKVWL